MRCLALAGEPATSTGWDALFTFNGALISKLYIYHGALVGAAAAPLSCLSKINF
jgi:hypothetical protein